MDFIDQLQALATKIQRQRDQIETEEATKNAFVMPFISLLGYDVFDPGEVVPEYTADVGIKKGEKVDYAIMHDGKPAILFECKKCDEHLDEAHLSQLFRYFTATEARIGVLTNGIVYRFFSDLEKTNQMDSTPFLEFNLLDMQESLLSELKKLTKPGFNLDEVLSTASDLKYTREIKLFLDEQVTEPSQDFVRFLASQVYPGTKTQNVLAQFMPITKRAFLQFINDHISKRLKSALGDEDGTPVMTRSSEEAVAPDTTPTASGQDSRVETTEEELEGYHIVKARLREIVEPQRIVHRDTVSYMGILLDDTNRKPICRLHFNRRQKYIGLFNTEKTETRHPIDTLNDIYQYADELKTTVGGYEEAAESPVGC